MHTGSASHITKCLDPGTQMFEEGVGRIAEWLESSVGLVVGFHAWAVGLRVDGVLHSDSGAVGFWSCWVEREVASRVLNLMK